MPNVVYGDAAPTTPLASVIQASTRLNPCLDLDVDVVAVEAAAGASTQLDWTTLGTIPAGLTVESDGSVHLTLGGPTTLFSQTSDHSVFQAFNDSGGSPGPAVFWLDFFPDPAVVGNSPLELSSIDLWLGLSISGGFFVGTFHIQVTQFDAFWNRQPIGDAIDINAKQVTSFPYTVDFIALGRRIRFSPGQLVAQSGQGLDGSGAARNVKPALIAGDLVSNLQTLRGFSIGISTTGANAYTLPFLGCAKTTSAAQFDVTKFWRVAQSQNRDCGPYSPYIPGAFPGNVNLFPGDGMGTTGAVPILGQSFGGAVAVTNGYWGRAKQILQGPPGPPAEGGRAQNASQGWHQPYHSLKVNAYTPTATGVWAIDLGLVPTQQVEVRLDDVQPKGTAIAYTLKGSATGVTGPWTAIGTVTDGQQLTPAELYRYYQLTAVFTTTGAHLASPTLKAWFMSSRVVFNTFTFVGAEVDSTSTADPLQAQTEIAELPLPLNRIGPRDYTDVATQINTNFPPTSIECYVYAKNRVSGLRYFLNSYRLENRDPQDGVEQMTFVSGLDQLQGEIPALEETYTYPLSGTDTITAVTSLGGGQYRVGVGTSPWTGVLNPNGLQGFVYYGITGANAGSMFSVQLNTGNTVTFTVLDINGGTNLQPAPQIGDTFQLHSQLFARPDITYTGVDYADIYADLLAVQSGCPARFRGQLPALTTRIGTGTVTNDNQQAAPGGAVSQSYKSAKDYLQVMALHCGGFLAWRRGRIDFVPFYGQLEAVDHWDDRHIVSLTPTVGADRRMPSIYVQYGYDLSTKAFAFGTTYNDINAVLGWGRSNLFDVYQFSDDINKWNDESGLEALYLANLFLSAWSTGVRFWKVTTALRYPWLQEGDAISIVTDMYTDRRMNFSADGLTDMGTPLKGPLAALGVIIGKNLWGDSFVLAIRGLSNIGVAGVNTNTGGGFAALACPAITATVEVENVNGIVVPVASVAWVAPTSTLYDHMELQIAVFGVTTNNVVMGATSPYRLVVSPNGLYTLTPTVVTKAGVRTVGAPITVSTGPNAIVSAPVTIGTPGGEIHGVFGPYTVPVGGTTPGTFSTWTGTNPNAATDSVGGAWVSAAAGAVTTLVTNPVAVDGKYTLTYTLVGTKSGSPAQPLVRAMLEYNIGGAGWVLYGYTPSQTPPYTGTGVTQVIALTGLVAGAASVAFRVTAQATFLIGSGVSVTATVTATSVAWNYSTSTPLPRTSGVQLIQAPPGEPHLSLFPQATPPTAAQSVAGELTMAVLGSATFVGPVVHDGNAVAIYPRQVVQYVTSDFSTTNGASQVVTGTGFSVTAGEAWVIEFEGAATATGGFGLFAQLLGSGGATFTIADWLDLSTTTSTTAFGTSTGAIGTLPAAKVSGGNGFVHQRWYVTILASGTVSIGLASNGGNTVVFKRGTMIRAHRVA